MNKSSTGRTALLLVATLLLQCALAGPLAMAEPSDGGEHRLPTGYLTIFQDDFEAGVIDRSKWLYWEGSWSTDNIAVNPSGGFYTKDDEIYLTESPYGTEIPFGDPLDDNGNDGIYYPDEIAMIETTWIDLHNVTMPRLEFEHMYDIPSPGDGAMVFVITDRDKDWELVEPEFLYPEVTGWSGTMTTWASVTVRLDDYAGQRIRIGFYFRSSPDGVEGDGWKIKDIEVGGKPDQQLPDLKLGNVRVLLDGYPVAAAVAGDVLEFNMTIINEGRASVDAFVVSAYTDHPLGGGDEIGRVVVLDGLSMGMSKIVTMHWIAVPGHYVVRIYVDEANHVPEESEVNNERTIEVNVDDNSAGDMVLTDMRFEADGTPIHGAGVGDLIEIVATIANVGTSMVTIPMVVRAYDGPFTPGTDPIGDVQPRLGGLEAGGERTIRIPWRPLEGVHDITMIVMPQDPSTPLDFNDANNVTSARLDVTDDPGVDLFVEDLHFILDGQVTTQASERDNVHTLAIIGNDGNDPYEGAIEVGVYRGDPDAGGVQVGRQFMIASLDPDETLQVEFDWRAELGTHAITIFVDPDNMIYESDEDNNQLGKGLTVSRRPLPDLAVGSMQLLLNGEELDLQEGTNSGAHVEVNVSVINRGNAKTKSVTMAELYHGNPLLSGKLLGSFEVPEGLNPDEVHTDSIIWIAEKPKQKSDVPVLFVVVDATGVEHEVDEFNNYDLRPLRVGASLPDLTVITIDITDQAGAPVSSITYGTTITIEVTVTNVGTDVSFQVAQLHIYLDEVDEGKRLANMATSTLGIGEESTKSITWTPVPNKVDGGTHTMIAVVDPINEIEESSDANNQLSSEIHIDGDALPNLLLMDLWVTQGVKTVDRLDEDDTATVHVRVVNMGDAPLFTPAVVEMFHGDPTQGGLPIGNWQITELDVGANITYQADWTFENGMPLMVYIDRNNMVEETNENDNVGTKQVYVEPPAEGANYVVIGAVIGLAILVLVIMIILVGRRPTAPSDEDEVREEPPDELSVEVDEEPAEEPEPAEPPAEEPEPAEPPAEEPEPAEPPAEVPEPAEPPAEEPEPAGPPAEEPEPAGPPAEEAPEAGPAAGTCPSCGEEVDPAWILCPFCDNTLR